MRTRMALRGEKKWRRFHRSEVQQKRRYLKRLSAREGLSLLEELYGVFYGGSRRQAFDARDREKLETLIRVHKIFGKVKT